MPGKTHTLDTNRLETTIKAHMQKTEVPALAISISQGWDVIYAKGFGKTGKDVAAEDVSEKTVFPLLSTNKPLTGSLIMCLVEQGHLNLDIPVIQYAPWLEYPPGGDIRRVTLRHLLSMCSGLSSDPQPTPEQRVKSHPDPVETHIREDLPTYSVIALPGDVFWYSNPGINLAGYIAQHVLGQSYTGLMQEYILDPLEMHYTTFDPIVAVAYSAALPHERDEHNRLRAKADFPILTPVSTVTDLANFAIMQMNGGQFKGRNLLKEETIAEMHRIHADAYTTRFRYYGLTFDIEQYKGLKIVSHGGGGDGFGSTFIMAPEPSIAISILFNQPGGYSFPAFSIFDELLHLPADEEKTPTDPDRTKWVSYVGEYENPSNLECYDEKVGIYIENSQLLLSSKSKSVPLVPVEEHVYQTSDGEVSVGFVPPKAGVKNTQYIMLNRYDIGLVSAVPCRRI